MGASQVLARPSEESELFGRHVVSVFFCWREYECPYGSAGKQVGPAENVGEETLLDRMPKVVCSGRFAGTMTRLPLKKDVGPSEPASIRGAPNVVNAMSGSRQPFRAQLKDPRTASLAVTFCRALRLSVVVAPDVSRSKLCACSSTDVAMAHRQWLRYVAHCSRASCRRPVHAVRGVRRLQTALIKTTTKQAKQ